MELTVLGKYGPYGKAGTGAASGYLVHNQDDYLVMDMGAGVLSRLTEAVDIRKVNAVFLSHLHFDHTSDLLPFRYLCEDLGKRMTILTQYEDSEWYRVLVTHPLFDVINIDENSRLTLGSLTLSFLPMKHTVPDLAVQVTGDATLTYTGDTMYNDNLPACFRNADCVLLDCSKPASFQGPHMTVENAKELSRKFGTRMIATHLSVDYDPTEEFRDFPNITVAEEKKTYCITKE